jgi:acetyl esterase
MRMDLRTKVFTAALGAVPGVAIAGMSLADIERAQARGFDAGIPGAWLVTGRRARGVEVDERAIPVDGREFGIRFYRARGATGTVPVVLNLHGGGWVLGGADSNEWTCSRVADRVGAVVVSLDYRLAPQHPFPAAREDALGALRWLAEHAGELGGDPDRLAIMGDSAGGNLAAVTALAARDEGGPALAVQALIYPGTDCTLASPSIHEKADAPVLTKADIETFQRHYLGHTDPADPGVSPLLAASHAGLPPTLLQTAEHDPLLDDGIRYAGALEAAGVPVRHTTYVGVPHGFYSFPGICRPQAEQALAELCGELARHLG